MKHLEGCWQVGAVLLCPDPLRGEKGSLPELYFQPAWVPPRPKSRSVPKAAARSQGPRDPLAQLGMMEEPSPLLALPTCPAGSPRNPPQLSPTSPSSLSCLLSFQRLIPRALPNTLISIQDKCFWGNPTSDTDWGLTLGGCGHGRQALGTKSGPRLKAQEAGAHR